jgi:hypothetical protein
MVSTLPKLVERMPPKAMSKQNENEQALIDEYANLQFLKLYLRSEIKKADQRQDEIKKELEKNL